MSSRMLDDLDNARAVIEELLRTDAWRSTRSGSQKSQEYNRARREAITFVARLKRAIHEFGAISEDQTPP